MSLFLSGYFIWLAEKAVPAEEASWQKESSQGGSDVSHPRGRQALRVLWALLGGGYSRKKLSRQGNVL